MQRSFRVRGKKVEIDEIPGLLAIRLDLADFRKHPQPGSPIAAWRGMVLVTAGTVELPQDTRSVLESAGWILARPAPEQDAPGDLPSPEVVGRLFRDEYGEWMIGTGRLNVRFRDDLDDDTVRELLERFRLAVVRQLKFAPQLYEVQAAEEDDFLEVADELDASEALVYAEPQLMRKLGGR